MFALMFLPLISVQFSRSIMSDSLTPWTAACQASLFITHSWSLLKLISIESMMSSNHLILPHPLLLLPSIFPSIRVFSSESVLCIRWPKYWSFSFNISSSNEYSGLISFGMDRLDLLSDQGTLKSLLQHHSSKIINYTGLNELMPDDSVFCLEHCLFFNVLLSRHKEHFPLSLKLSVFVTFW